MLRRMRWLNFFFKTQKKATPPLQSHYRSYGLFNEPSGASVGAVLTAHDPAPRAFSRNCMLRRMRWLNFFFKTQKNAIPPLQSHYRSYGLFNEPSWAPVFAFLGPQHKCFEPPWAIVPARFMWAAELFFWTPKKAAWPLQPHYQFHGLFNEPSWAPVV